MNILKECAGTLLLVCMLWAQPALAGDGQSGHHRGMRAVGGPSPLIEEMLKLDEAFREIVSAVALDDSDRVRNAVESMHGSMEKTHEAMHHGSVTIPKNADRIEDFVRQDKEFHARLENLSDAAARNDRDAMRRITKDLLDRCVTCHRDFRKR